MTECTDLKAELQNQLQVKAQLEQKQIEKADQMSQDDPNVIITHGVQGILENCLNAIEAMEQDRIHIHRQIQSVQNCMANLQL